MIKIVITDDEKLIRAGISKILTNELKNQIKLFEARNGKEALDICSSEHIDVLITDIRMPVKDGIDLMKEISILQDKPSIIVLSGFDDFEYARAAIQNGAVSYILKPVDKKELIDSVNKAIEIKSLSQQQKNEQTLKKIIGEGRIVNTVEQVNIDFLDGFYCVIMAGLDCNNIIKNILQPGQYYILENKKNFVCAVIPKNIINTIDFNNQFLSLKKVISLEGKDLSAMRSLKRQAMIAFMAGYFPEYKNKDYIQFSPDMDIDNTIELDSRYEKNIASVGIDKPEQIRQNIKKMFNFSDIDKNHYAASLLYLYEKITSNLFNRYPTLSSSDLYLHLKGIMIETIWQFENLDEWIDCICDYEIYVSMQLSKDNHEYPFIDKALEYIKTNFNKNINMTMVANYVSINYTWFSEKFKEHTGINFNDYLKKLRIEEAQKLLLMDCYKVYEVAKRSGFRDEKYFMKVFRETTGLSPSEWKKIHC